MKFMYSKSISIHTFWIDQNEFFHLDTLCQHIIFFLMLGILKSFWGYLYCCEVYFFILFSRRFFLVSFSLLLTELLKQCLYIFECVSSFPFFFPVFTSELRVYIKWKANTTKRNKRVFLHYIICKFWILSCRLWL